LIFLLHKKYKFLDNEICIRKDGIGLVRSNTPIELNTEEVKSITNESLTELSKKNSQPTRLIKYQLDINREQNESSLSMIVSHVCCNLTSMFKIITGYLSLWI